MGRPRRPSGRQGARRSRGSRRPPARRTWRSALEWTAWYVFYSVGTGSSELLREQGDSTAWPPGWRVIAGQVPETRHHHDRGDRGDHDDDEPQRRGIGSGPERVRDRQDIDDQGPAMHPPPEL